MQTSVLNHFTTSPGLARTSPIAVLAAPRGFEPRFTDPKSAVLPLDEGATASADGARARKWSGRRDSNPRPSPWQGDALPTEPLPLGSCARRVCWCREPESNWRHRDFQSRALPTELSRPGGPGEPSGPTALLTIARGPDGQQLTSTLCRVESNIVRPGAPMRRGLVSRHLFASRSWSSCFRSSTNRPGIHVLAAPRRETLSRWCRHTHSSVGLGASGPARPRPEL